MDAFIQNLKKTGFKSSLSSKNEPNNKKLFEFFLLNILLLLLISLKQAFSYEPFSQYYIMTAFIILVFLLFCMKILPRGLFAYLKPIFAFLMTLTYFELFVFCENSTNFFQFWTFGLFHIIISEDIYWISALEVPFLSFYYILRISEKISIFHFGGLLMSFWMVFARYQRISEEKQHVFKLSEEIEEIKAYKDLIFDEFDGSLMIMGLKKKQSNNGKWKKIKGKLLSLIRKKPNLAKNRVKYQNNSESSEIFIKEMNRIAKITYGNLQESQEKLINFLDSLVIEPKNEQNSRNHFIFDQKHDSLNLLVDPVKTETINNNIINIELSDVDNNSMQSIVFNMLRPNYNKQTIFHKVLIKSPDDKPPIKANIKLFPLKKSIIFMIETIILTDLSKEHQSTNEFCKEIEFLKKNDVAKTHLLASVSHDMRSPLNGIIFYLKSAKETENLFLRNQKLDYALINSQLLLFLINDLLDFSQHKHNSKLSLNLTKFSLNSVLDDIISCIRIEAANKGLNLLVQNECNKNLSLMSDERRLKQVLINLLTNAIKFTFQGYVKLKLSPVLNYDNLIKIEVIDTGLGIKSDFMPLLMTPFATFDLPDRKINRNGIGLGLYICKTIAETLGPNENLFVHSEFGKGSKFGFLAYIINEGEHAKENNLMKIFENELEVFQEENALESDMREIIVKSRNISSKSFYNKSWNVTSNSGTTYSKKSRSSRKLRNTILNGLSKNPSEQTLDSNYIRALEIHNVLIVDDQVFNLMILYEMLMSIKELPLAVEKATNGLMALELFCIRNAPDSDEEPYKLIFMDCEMPLMNGIDATKLIRNKIFKEGFKDVRIIGCTGDYEAVIEIQEGNKKKNNELTGMDECFPKPIDTETIFKCLKKYL